MLGTICFICKVINIHSSFNFQETTVPNFLLGFKNGGFSLVYLSQHFLQDSGKIQLVQEQDLNSIYYPTETFDVLFQIKNSMDS